MNGKLIACSFAGCLMLLAACDRPAVMAEEENLLPPNTTLPVSTRTAQGSTEVETQWANGNMIGITVKDNAQYANVPYTYDGATQNWSSATPICWKYKNQPAMTLSAYYPYSASGYVTFSINENQNSADNYFKSDLLHSGPINVAYEGTATFNDFNHVLSKAIFKLTFADQKLNNRANATVTISNQPTSVNITGGTASSPQGDKTITAYKASGDDYTRRVILIPQTAAITPTIMVTVGSEKYTGTLPSTIFETGKQYTYNVEVKKELKVSAPSITAWTVNATHEVILYRAQDLKIGDYFYSDGTYSDGGLRAFNTQTGQTTYDETISRDENRTCVGRIFSTRMSEADKTRGWKKAYVIYHSIRIGAGYWMLDPYKDTKIPNISTLKDGYNDLDGYQHTQDVMTQATEEGDTYSSKYPQFNAASSITPVPPNTSGWFMASMGQIWDLAENTSPSAYVYLKNYRTSTGRSCNPGSGEIGGMIKTFLSKAGGTNNLTSMTVWYSSSECGADDVYSLCNSGGWNGWGRRNKHQGNGQYPNTSFPVLAF